MTLTVWVASWQLEEDGRVVGVGDEVAFPLTFRDAERAPDVGLVQTIDGVARALPAWPGSEHIGHAVRVDIAGGALYWSPPSAVEGPVRVEGVVVSNAGEEEWDGFPATRGTIRRVWMGWNEIIHHQPGQWRRTDRPTRYEDVPASYLPHDERVQDLGIDSDEQIGHHPDGGRLGTDAKSFVSLGYPPPRKQPAVGAVRPLWTGVLLDFEPIGLEPS